MAALPAGENMKMAPVPIDLGATSSPSESEDVPDGDVASTSSRANYDNLKITRKKRSNKILTFGSLEQLQLEAALDFNDENESEEDVEMLLHQAVHSVDHDDVNDDDDDDDDNTDNTDIDYCPPSVRGRGRPSKKQIATERDNSRRPTKSTASTRTTPEKCVEAIEDCGKIKTRSKGKRIRKTSAPSRKMNDNAADGLDLKLNNY